MGRATGERAMAERSPDAIEDFSLPLTASAGVTIPGASPRLRGSKDRDGQEPHTGLPHQKPSNSFATWYCKKLQKHRKETTRANTTKDGEDFCLE